MENQFHSLAVSNRNKQGISDLKKTEVYFSIVKVQSWCDDSAPQSAQGLKTSPAYHSVIASAESQTHGPGLLWAPGRTMEERIRKGQSASDT